MRVMFFGTPEFAIPTLEAVSQKFKVMGVFTQPDSKKGRGMKVIASPVKDYALAKKYPVYQPAKLKEFDLVSLLEETKTDVGVVVAYGQKIPKEALDVPKFGFINVHASLLPKLRGAAPIERCILNGDEKTGVTIMYLAEGMDTGDIGLQEEIELDDKITGGELSEKMSIVGAEMAVELIKLLRRDEAPRMEQEHKHATYAPKITSGDLYSSFDEKCDSVLRRIRAFSPATGVKMTVRGVAAKVFKASKVDIDMTPFPRGRVYPGTDKKLIMSFKDGWMEIEEIQPAAHKKITGAEFIRGYRI